MTNKIKSGTAMLIVLLFTISLLFAIMRPAAADSHGSLWGNTDSQQAVAETFGTSASTVKDPREIAGAVIQVIFGFLGILATAFILWGGFKWMTARGNEEQVAEARKLIVSAVVGLVIILSAYALSQFVLREIYGATKTP